MSKPGPTVVLLFATLLIVSIGQLVYPMIVIQPFRHQGETELKAALWIIQWRPYFEAVAVAGAIATMVWYWSWRTGRRARAGAILATILICGAAALSRVNVFELMFHRYDRPAFSQGADAKLDADDKVLAIALNGQGRAYPIRTIAYHHIINDEVGGIPVVATY